jgi:L-seryl-tRNA(Ser) seleniumtransferase
VSDLYRQLPKVDRVIEDPALGDLPRGAVLEAAREVLDALRQAIGQGLAELPEVVPLIRARTESRLAPRLRRVVNATGVVLHTNLGRAPLPPAAVTQLMAVASGYSNAELDLETGKRGGRLDGVREPLRALIGCEDAIAVNNNAAAVFLALSTICRAGEAIVSRGELVEIGGSFRIPDIMASAGAVLREVGATNRTRAADYAGAINDQTRALLRVHPSNFRIIGFTERPTTTELSELAHRFELPLIEDLGSGALVEGLGDEPVVSQVLADGADLVLFSGDKLLGGPQAGILAGKRELVQRCRRNPLYRALRLDKLVLAALEGTLRAYLSGERGSIPTVRMLTGGSPAEPLAGLLRGCGLKVSIEEDVGFTGGGALPGQGLPTRVVALRGRPPQDLAARLRAHDPPVIARVARDALLLDPRTLLPGELELVVAAVRAAASAD